MPIELTRRSVLHSAAGLGLSFLMPALQGLAADERGPKREKSLIILWMAGGPSQLETWDPHPNSKTSHTDASVRETAISGLQIDSRLEQMADQMADLNVIRTLTSKEGDHERGSYFVKTGYMPDPKITHPSVTAITTELLPVSEELKIPPHVSLANGPFPARGGFLGDTLDAFRVFNPGGNLTNLRAPVNDKRQQRRLDSLDVVSRAFSRGRKRQTERTLHQLTVERALAMMNTEQLKAFQLDDVPSTEKNAYGESRFGRGCLVARRLVETGVRSVEVVLNGWDTHVSNFEGCTTQLTQLDPAFAALMRDLKERDLFDSTVVLCIGEFGRTPKVNALDGRDHWPKWFSCVVGGGGFTRGQVIGETDPDGLAETPADPIGLPDLYATVFKALGIDHEHEFYTDIGRPISATFNGVPIDRLLV